MSAHDDSGDLSILVGFAKGEFVHYVDLMKLITMISRMGGAYTDLQTTSAMFMAREIVESLLQGDHEDLKFLRSEEHQKIQALLKQMQEFFNDENQEQRQQELLIQFEASVFEALVDTLEDPLKLDEDGDSCLVELAGMAHLTEDELVICCGEHNISIPMLRNQKDGTIELDLSTLDAESHQHALQVALAVTVAKGPELKKERESRIHLTINPDYFSEMTEALKQNVESMLQKFSDLGHQVVLVRRAATALLIGKNHEHSERPTPGPDTLPTL